jgi:hypothetical protein
VEKGLREQPVRALLDALTRVSSGPLRSRPCCPARHVLTGQERFTEQKRTALFLAALLAAHLRRVVRLQGAAST